MKVTDEKPEITLRRAAMNLLARREHSFHELEQKLAEKYPELAGEGLIRPVVSRLCEEKLQSDERFLESYVRFRRNKGFGPLKIEAELYHKGLDTSLIREYLYAPENDWEACCREALQKRFGPGAGEGADAGNGAADLREQQKQQRFLLQRGFSTEEIRRVTKSR